jgi:hypothetical protein
MASSGHSSEHVIASSLLFLLIYALGSVELHQLVVKTQD